ncbi:hypothetical protein RhiLY_10029 [Ceratobasidium sp. AG-Ba]|nr:hypothetical protein RhiLY_10029 [Ceratobasidium sp. AG-Ba]
MLPSYAAWTAHPEDQNLTFPPPGVPDSSYTFLVRLTARAASNTNRDSLSDNECTFAGTSRGYPGKRGNSSWFRLYSCPGDTIDYTIIPQRGELNAPAMIPKLWFGELPDDLLFDNQSSRVERTPYLAPGIQPSIGLYQTISRALTIRRFISSSGLKDAVTGSQPSYQEVRFHLPFIFSNITDLISTTPINSTNSTCESQSNDPSPIACGSVQAPTGLLSHPQITDKQLRDKKHIDTLGATYCQIIEDYRTSGAFDVLGSIGGLIALLQGVHMFLFGRPLFWGLFGAKLLTPFGFLGRFASQSFRQRLQDHYTIQPVETDAAQDDIASLIRMNRFLLDYILDMGPVLPTSSQPVLNQSNPNLTYPSIAFSYTQNDPGYDEQRPYVACEQ